MDEALVALDLASNIVHSVSFASELVSRGYEIGRPVDGGLVESLELEVIASTLLEPNNGLSRLVAIKSLLSQAKKRLQEIC